VAFAHLIHIPLKLNQKTYMDKKTIETKYAPLINKSGAVVYKGVNTINYKPHPFVISVKHVACADKYNNGKLDQSVLSRYACSRPGCDLPYDQHTHNAVILVALTQHCTKAAFSAALQEAQAASLEADGIDGILLVDTVEQFRIV
jgi:hypothetical protein